MNCNRQALCENITHCDYFLWKGVFFLYTFGFLFNEICKRYSLIPIATIIRLLLVVILYEQVILKRFIIGRNLTLFLGGTCFLTVYYLFISLCNSDFLTGLLLYRYYLEPILLLLLLLIYLDNGADIDKLYNIFIRNIIFTALVSILLYTMFLMGYIDIFINPDIPDQFFLPGGIILRSYLPVGGPNELGLLLMIGIALILKQQHIKKWTIIILLLSLLLTISKSALLALSFFIVLSLFTFKLKHIFIIVVVITIFVTLFLSIDFYFLNSLLYSYFENLFSGNDPSVGGHSSSLVEAIENFPDYYLWGYPTGTVGPRVDTIYNVESSFLLLCYDKGIFFAFFFLLIVGIGLYDRIKISDQRNLIISVCLALSVLPTIQSVEVFSLTLISPLLLKRCAN